MTANELADKCNRLQGEIILGFLADCATMLRQQAKEIESLKQHGYSELTEDEIKEVYDQYFDLENFGWLHLQCIRAILQKASEK
jgi:hypothetical protein